MLKIKAIKISSLLIVTSLLYAGQGDASPKYSSQTLTNFTELISRQSIMYYLVPFIGLVVFNNYAVLSFVPYLISEFVKLTVFGFIYLSLQKNNFSKCVDGFTSISKLCSFIKEDLIQIWKYILECINNFTSTRSESFLIKIFNTQNIKTSLFINIVSLFFISFPLLIVCGILYFNLRSEDDNKNKTLLQYSAILFTLIALVNPVISILQFLASFVFRYILTIILICIFMFILFNKNEQFISDDRTKKIFFICCLWLVFEFYWPLSVLLGLAIKIDPKLQPLPVES